MFIDCAKIHVKAGKGRDGIVIFRREKYIAYDGLSGGDGGVGGDVIFMVDKGKTILLDLRYNRKMTAESGRNGKTKKMHGADGADCIIKAPQGTFVKDEKTEGILTDFTRKGQKKVIAEGGEGGRGNSHFKSSRNTAPQHSELGAPGEERDITVELKVLVDIGLVGFSSVGRSTSLSVVSKAKSEIAEYHPTTLAPDLGMVQVPDGGSFVMADLPGLIEGASKGKGLGHQFLRHIERCRVIIHAVDMRAGNDRDPVAGYETTDDELKQYEYHLVERPQIILTNKMDPDGAQESSRYFRKAYPEVEVFEATTIIVGGLEPVPYRAAGLLETTLQSPLYNNDASGKEAEDVLYKSEPGQSASEVHNIGNGNWELSGEELERSLKMSKMDNKENFMRFARKIRKMGIGEVLRKVGYRSGDVVTICDIQFEFVKQRHTNTPFHETWIGFMAKKQGRRNTRLKRGSRAFFLAFTYPTKICIVSCRRMIARLQAVTLNSEIKEDLTSYQCSAGSFSIE